jgi:hypothetical protein
MLCRKVKVQEAANQQVWTVTVLGVPPETVSGSHTSSRVMARIEMSRQA